MDMSIILKESNMNQKWINMYMDIAVRISQESHAIRLKVGAVFVSPEGVMSIGINGMPAGGTNVCEYYEDVGLMRSRLVTKPECSHAESAVFGKLMRQGVCTKGGSIFITHSPCIQCAKIIVAAGITHVHYKEEYRDNSGINWLKKNNIIVIKE
jgi:dCMP deaminase